MTSVSVAMAVYNGETYLKEQLDSILIQLKPSDELIISYNESSDNTWNIITAYAEKYPVIHIFTCNEKGVFANFENAILHCTNDIIFLCDQDDVWNPDKVETVVKTMEKDHSILALHNCEYTDEHLNSQNLDLFKDRNVKEGYFHNLLINGYQGSCMAFRKDLISLIIPIPREIAMHDQWIGLLAEKAGKISFIDQSLMKYRRHEDSSSSDYVGISRKIRWMILMNSEIRKRTKKSSETVKLLRKRYFEK